MAAASDLKSEGRDTVWVRLPLPVLRFKVVSFNQLIISICGAGGQQVPPPSSYNYKTRPRQVAQPLKGWGTLGKNSLRQKIVLLYRNQTHTAIFNFLIFQVDITEIFVSSILRAYPNRHRGWSQKPVFVGSTPSARTESFAYIAWVWNPT